ncbi:MAG: GNAT family N-acetyltransferase [Candidatus Heimdallarchaeota archaeon]|nr:GNAT family N-acetyltransferase [Candidatus Heimdallarchaeota archaeon]
MVWDRIGKIFRTGKKFDPESFQKLLSMQPLSQTCYMQWYLLKKPHLISINSQENPFSYIFHYENKYFLSGVDVWKLRDRIRWFKTNNILFFTNESLWPEIQERFTNFRSLETNSHINIFNSYSTYKMTVETFNPKWENLSSIIKFPNNKLAVPKRYRHLDIHGGVAYGYLKDDEIVSFAAAPHIHQSEHLSFAIIRGIETKLLERKQGYSNITLTKLCQELLSNLLIKELFLWVEDSNEPAIKLYEKLGFVKDNNKIFATFCDLKV